MAEIDASKLTLSTKQVQDYFNPPGPNWIVGIAIFIGVCVGFMIHAIVGFLAILGSGYWLYKRSKKDDTTRIPTDEEIDNNWKEIAAQRVDEAYRVAHIDKSDVIKDAEYFWAYPSELPDQENPINVAYTSKEGKDKLHRRNYLRLVYMIYAKDQLIVFDENICIENNWEGVDNIQEYYWKDVSSIGFDQKNNSMEIACGPKIIDFPLQGESSSKDNFSTEAAEAISNSVRVILRERKSS
tara:strand:+ start:315 stop:1034 length:720 start_codon:yes stop_codon:yes gene_type:complete